VTSPAGGGAIDIVMNPYTTPFAALRPEWSKAFLTKKVDLDDEWRGGFSDEQQLAKLDRAGVAHAFLIAAKAGSKRDAIQYQIPYDMVAQACADNPSKYSGLAGIDPFDGMTGVRELERAIVDLGFVGAHLYPHWFGLAPDHAKYYPFYAKCAELDVPVQIQVGHCLRYSDERPLVSVGRPSCLDVIACDFPELKIVGIHIGWPWTEEMISVAYKHPNVYIGSDAYAPKHWPAEFVKYIDSWGQDKVLFGTDFPVIDPERAMAEIDDLGLRPVSKQKLLRDNALSLYRLNRLTG
jgi:uncharacterized protein